MAVSLSFSEPYKGLAVCRAKEVPSTSVYLRPCCTAKDRFIWGAAIRDPRITWILVHQNEQ